MKNKSRIAPAALIASGVLLIIAGVVIGLPKGPTVTPTPPAPVFTPTPTLTPTPTHTPSPTPTPTPVVFDGEEAYRLLSEQMEIGPRPVGSEGGWATGDYILEKLDGYGWETTEQEFVFKGVRGRNVIGHTGDGPLVILGAHYDTRPAADHDPDPENRDEHVPGANDGASGVAVLLELARSLDKTSLQNEVWLAFFDAEDMGGLDGWPFCVGSAYMAQRVSITPKAVVVVDMVGDADQQLYYEHNSDPELQEELWDIADTLGYSAWFIPEYRHSMYDDHIPFRERGFPAIDIIDFDYPYWHTIQDTADKNSPESLERVGRVLETWLEGGR